jgi:hypothetical protein
VGKVLVDSTCLVVADHNIAVEAAMGLVDIPAGDRSNLRDSAREDMCQPGSSGQGQVRELSWEDSKDRRHGGCEEGIAAEGQMERCTCRPC